MNLKKKIKTGITGSIGSGKSVFCGILEENGYTVINVDDLSKKILETDDRIRKQIIKKFGEDTYSGAKLNRQYLAEKVFNEDSGVITINSIVHPVVKMELARVMNEVLEKEDVVFAEAALIYEADMEDMFDFVILVTADEAIRKKRKTAGSNLSQEQFDSRNYNQIPDEEKRKRADFIFENGGSITELKYKAQLLLKILKGLNN